MVCGGCAERKPEALAVEGSGSGPRWRRNAHHDVGGTYGRPPVSHPPFHVYGRPGRTKRHGWG
jgi:hypothetical protein